MNKADKTTMATLKQNYGNASITLSKNGQNVSLSNGKHLSKADSAMIKSILYSLASPAKRAKSAS